MKKASNFSVKTLMIISILFVYALLSPNPTAYAAITAVQVASVEYYEEQIIVFNNGNTNICFATEIEASKNNWEIIDADSGAYTMIDISWLSPTVENIIVIKGLEDPTQTQSRVILKEKPTKLEVSINYTNIDKMSNSDPIAPLVNIMTSEGTGSDPVDFDDLEWRKGTTGQWTTTRTLTVGMLEKYLVKGTYIYFRIRAVDDHVSADYDGDTLDINKDRIDGIPGGIQEYDDPLLMTGISDFPDGTDGRRFSNEIKVKVAKKSTAMVYGIDGEEFTAEIKYGKEYRVTSGTTTSDWIQVTDRAVKKIPLYKIINDGSSNGTTEDKAFPEMLIEVRDYATTKAASSKITEIYLEEQRTIDEDNLKDGKAPANAIANGDKNIYVYYNGNKNMVITIPSATPKLPYEFCVVKPNDTFNLERVVWTSITKGTEVKILASKAVEGGTLYVRMKEIQSKQATNTSDAIPYALASTYVTHVVSYPSIPVFTKASYTFTKGYSGAITFDVILNVDDKDPFETAIKNIKLGTKEIVTSFTVSETTTPKVATMHITLSAASLSTMTNCYNKAITITFANGTVDKTSIKLTIQSPTPAPSVTATVAKGTNPSTTALTMVTSKGAGNTWAYVIGAAAITNVNTLDKIAGVAGGVTGTAFTTTTVDNITVTAGQYLTVFELDSTGNIVKYKSIQITTEYIR